MSGNKNALKRRIKSVKSTQKITKAMKMVAASKLRKAVTQSEAANIYATKLKDILTEIINSSPLENLDLPLLLNDKPLQTHLFIVTSSERGLCGSFNSSIIKTTKKLIGEFRSKGKLVKILCIGKKSYELLKHDFSDNILDSLNASSKKQFTYDDAVNISNKILTYFCNNEFDSCSIVFNKFNSIISQDVTNFQLIPLSCNQVEVNESQFEYEPTAEELLEDILPKNLVTQIFCILLENLASEQAARMNAMDNATNSASDMIKSLSLIYNRTRQADITRELIEIISGAEAIQ